MPSFTTTTLNQTRPTKLNIFVHQSKKNLTNKWKRKRKVKIECHDGIKMKH